MKKGIFKKVLVLMLMGAFFLTGCGSKSKSVDGYWLCRTARDGYGVIYLHIDGSKAEYVTNLDNIGSYTYFKQYEGTAEKTEDGVDIYFSEYSKYVPLHAKVSEDGNTLYLSSDNDSWNTEIHNRTDKETFEEDIADGQAYPRDDDTNSPTAGEASN